MSINIYAGLVQSLSIDLSVRHDAPKMYLPVADSPYYHTYQELSLFANDVVKSPVFDLLHFGEAVAPRMSDFLHATSVFLNRSRLSEDAQSFLEEAQFEFLFIHVSRQAVWLVSQVDKAVGVQSNRSIEERAIDRFLFLIRNFCFQDYSVQIVMV